MVSIDQPDTGTGVQAIEGFRTLPLRFEVNYGQTDPQVDFITRGRGYTVFLTPREAVLMLRGSGTSMNGHGQGRSSAVLLRLQFIGASAQPRAVGLEELPGRVNYFGSNDPTRWRTNIPTYAKVRYDEIYPGIDLVYYGNQRQLEYDFVVRPGADPKHIVLAFEGAQKIEVDAAGDLLLHMAGGVIRHRKPVVYQEVDGARREIAGGYVAKGAREVGFKVAPYDRSRPLVIDPVLFYSTYLGGVDDDDGDAIAIDADGSVYVTGGTVSIDFPTAAGAFQPAQAGIKDSFVVKLDPAGSVVYSTYLGGAGEDVGRGIVVDGAGNAYVAGETESVDFPTTPGAFRTTLAGLMDVFVIKLDPTGAALVYSTYVGGANDDEPTGIALDASGDAYVAGETASLDFPTTAGAFRATLAGGLTDAFVIKLDSTGGALVYSTYLGGTGDDDARGIAIDGAGNAYVTGETASLDFPATAGAFRLTLAGLTDAFVTKLDPVGSTLVYSTYLGGTRADRGFAIALDALPDPNAYITGRTASGEFPTTAGAFQATLASPKLDAFVTKLDPAGSTLVYSTYLGGAGDEEAQAIAVDASGHAHVTGRTLSTAFPTTAGAFRTTLSGRADAFVTKLGPAGSVLAYSTYLGGGGEDDGRGIAVDAVGSIYVTGQTASTDFPATAGAADTTFNGIADVFVVKIADFGPPATLTLAPATASTTVNTQHCVTAAVRDASGNPVPGVTARFAVTGVHSTTGSARTDGSGQAPFCYTGTKAGDDTITAFADTNHNVTQETGEPGSAATKIWTPGPPATLTLAPSSGANPVSTQHCVAATVRDAFGNPVPGVTVPFTVSGSVTAAGSAPTDANGQASFCYMGPAQPGDDAITAFADTNTSGVQDPGEPGDTATKSWVGPPATLTLAPEAITNAVNTQHCVTAMVRDGVGHPVSGVTVSFTVTGAVTAAGSGTTGANGQASFCYMGPAQPGDDAITAFADTNTSGVQDPGEPGDTATKSWVHPPATVTLAPAAASTTVNTQHCVTAAVSDAAGNPVPGVTARFAVTGSVTTTGSAATGANGQASFCYMGPAQPGSDTITAFADTNHNVTQDTGEPGSSATKTWTPGPPATLTLAPSAATTPVNTQHCVSATVRDTYGNPVPGVTVPFTVTGAVTAAGSAATGANGQATFCYMGPFQAGTDSIAAYADTNNSGVQDPGEPGGTATNTWAVPGVPATLALAPSAATTPVNGQHCVTAAVRDAFGTAVAGVTVPFAVSGSVATTGAAPTDASGQATFCYMGPAQPGTDTITAFADTNSSGARDAAEPGDTATKTWVGPPAALTLAPNAATTPVNTQHCVTGTVRDAIGTPNAGVTVRFTVSGSVAATGEAPTDANGQATFCYMGPSQAGSDTITAFADTNNSAVRDPAEPGDTATNTWAVPGAAAALTLAPEAATNPAATQHCVTATVRDAFGDPVPGVTVGFAVTGSVATTGTAATDASGQAAFCYMGPSQAGTDSIAAYADTNNNSVADGGEPSDTATKTWVVS